MKTLWENPLLSKYDTNLCSWEVAFEAAQEMMDEHPDFLSLDIAEYRAAEVGDIDTAFLTDEVWDCLSDMIQTHEDLSHDDGWPNLESLKGPIVAGRPKAWQQLKAAIEQVLADHVDMCEAAWQPTGKTRRVHRDGEGYRWEEPKNA